MRAVMENNLPHYFARFKLSADAQAKLEAGTHEIHCIINRQIILRPIEKGDE